MNYKSPISILLTDDDEDDREIFTDIIHKVNGPIKLESANSGLDLLNKLSQNFNNLPDLLFLDLNMPGMDGRECLNRLKSCDTLTKLPVIMFSTSAAIEDIDFAYEKGADLYLIKPNKFSSYFKLLKDVLEMYVSNSLPVKDKKRFVYAL
ncbi:MAG: response regulator [Bacteroidia bacterium]|nr:response regulator [Bacteroidia bacterium]